MKKTNAQFALVFVGALLLHLAVATALMKSAETDEARRSVTVVNPTYHSDASEARELARGPGGENEAETDSTSEQIPDAFADLSESTPPPPADPVPPPPIPEKTLSASEKDPASESSTRRLTVTQLLAADSKVPKVKPLSLSAPDANAPVPGIKRVPPKEANTGPRKVRSLSGN